MSYTILFPCLCIIVVFIFIIYFHSPYGNEGCVVYLRHHQSSSEQCSSFEATN